MNFKREEQNKREEAVIRGQDEEMDDTEKKTRTASSHLPTHRWCSASCDKEVREGYLGAIVNLKAPHSVVAIDLKILAIDDHASEAVDGHRARE